MINILGKIASISFKKWRDEIDLQGKKLPREITTLYDAIAKTTNPIKEESLEELKNHAVKENNPFVIRNLFLPPLDASEMFVPVASVEYIATPIPKISLRVGMHCINEGKMSVPGYRLETGHAESNHNYCHIQFTNNPFSQEWVESIPSVSENCPCILIPAKCPVTLVLCMLISFYGKLICQFFPEFPTLDKKYQNPFGYLDSSENLCCTESSNS